MGHIPQHSKSAKPAPTALQATQSKPEKEAIQEDKASKISFKPPNVNIFTVTRYFGQIQRTERTINNLFSFKKFQFSFA